MNQNLLKIALLLSLLFGFTACGGGGEDQALEEQEDSTTTEESNPETAPEEEEEEAKPLELEVGMTPFDFPAKETRAKVGDYLLCPSYKMWQNKLAKEDPTRETYIFYTAEMAEPGDLESKVKFTFDGEQMMPNSMLISIPQGQTAAVGDIVLTWWQTGSGMQRAIVTEASNPAEPKVRYLDLSWDNPAKDRETGKGIGQTEYSLKPNSFVKLNAPFQPGSAIAARDNGKWVSTQVVSMKDGKVLCIGFAGKMKVYDRKDCFNIPQKTSVKPGDKVKAVFVGSFSEATVSRVDEKMGVVFVKFENNPEEKPVSFGQITTTLPDA